MTTISINELKAQAELKRRAEKMVANGTMPTFTEALTALQARREYASRRAAKTRAAKGTAIGHGSLLPRP